jgi:phosphatidate cytidylyltransferase
MLRERVITALILAPFLLWVLVWAPDSVTVPVIGGVVLLGAWEWAQFCGCKQHWQRALYVVAIGVAMALAWQAADSPNGLLVTWGVALLWWCVAFGWLALMPQRVHALFAGLAGFLVLTPTWLALVHLDRIAEQHVTYLLFVLLLVFAADIGAYFSGRAFGRLKLAPRVSPGKTWEGALGGMLSAALISLAGAYWFDLPLSRFIPLCMAVAVVSIIGDLTESMFKRHSGLKDSSQLLPGHGGILDRIDSITAATPVFALGLLLLGVL